MMPPKLESAPGRKRNGPCSDISRPFKLAPLPLVIELIVQSCPSGLIAAGELGGITDVGRPVEAKVPERVTATGKLCTSFLNAATEKIDCGAKYHSKARS